MSISSIQAGGAQFDILQQDRRVREKNDDYGLRSQSDSVSISDEARQMALAANKQAGQQGSDSGSFLDNAAQHDDEEAPKSLRKISLLGMMMESLFMAELDENGAAQSGAEAGQGAETTQKQSGLMQDGEKAGELKKLMNDFAKGKIDLSDIPAAMALGKSGTSGSNGMTGRGAATQNNNQEKFI